MKPGPVLKERSLDPFSNGIQDAVAATTDSTHQGGHSRSRDGSKPIDIVVREHPSRAAKPW